jgi:Na+-translocating ferredoxin:NAD+ oxidoreductase RnfC subunit
VGSNLQSRNERLAVAHRERAKKRKAQMLAERETAKRDGPVIAALKAEREKVVQQLTSLDMTLLPPPDPFNYERHLRSMMEYAIKALSGYP